MPAVVELSTKIDANAILKSLHKVHDEALRSSKEVGQLGKQINENLEKTSKKTEQSIKQTGSVLRRMASQLYSDFKALMSLQSLQVALKLSNMFEGAIAQGVDLSDTIRKLGTSFGIAKSDFGKFNDDLNAGLAEIGASSDEAARALEGLTGLGLKDKNAIMNLTKGAVELGGISNERGNIKGIAGKLGSTLQAEGKNPNDMGAQRALIGEITAAVKTTGKGASEILDAMNDIFSKMPQDLRKKIGPKFMAQMASVVSVAGPGATAAMQKMFGMDKVQRMGLEAQGFHPFNKQGGMDMDSLMKFIKDVGSRGGMGARVGLKTAGFSDEEAEGLARMAEQADRVKDTLKTLEGASRDTEQEFKDSRGMVDNFKAAINTTKDNLSNLFHGGEIAKGMTDMLQKASSSKLGSAALVGGGATIAAMLAGGGIRGIVGLAGGEMKKKMYEEATGEKVQDVFVVNADQISSGGGGIGSTLGSVGKTAGGLGLALAGGMAVGEGVNMLDKKMGGGMSDAIVAGFDKLDKWMGGAMSGTNRGDKTKVYIETKSPNLRASDKPSRGSAN